MLLDTADGSSEEIRVPEATISALAGFNISVERKLNLHAIANCCCLHYSGKAIQYCFVCDIVRRC